MVFLYLFFIGACIGSFLNVLIDSLPNKETIFGRSHCDFCRKKIPWYDLIPLASFIFLRGYTRCCRKKLSFFYPLVEGLTGLFFVAVYVFIPTQTSIEKFALFGVISCLIVIFFADAKYTIIPDEILIACAIFSLPFFLQNPRDHLVSAVALYLFFQIIHSLSKGHAMGFGDVKFAGVIGFLQGFKVGVLSVYLAFLIGGLIGMVLVGVHQKKMKSKIAFGPFLVMGILITLFFEKELFLLIDQWFF